MILFLKGKITQLIEPTGHFLLVSQRRLKGLQKINKGSSPEVTTRLKHIITSIQGDREKKTVREFVDNYLLAKDAKALRTYYTKIQPDVDMGFIYKDENNEEEAITIPITVNFFWPDSTI